jgi:isopenicillin-N N-acyltransferase-like protein
MTDTQHYPPFPLIEISGTPFERGRMHGAAATDRVHLSVGHYEAQLAASGIHGERIDEIVRQYLPVIEAYEPAYVEEMRGIAAGSGLRFEQIVLVNARTEILHMARRELAMTPAATAAEAGKTDGCTGIVVMPEATRARRVLHAQNWDWKAECAHTAVVLRIRRDDGPDILTFTEAGGLARAGLNAAGLAITANYLECDRDFTSVGVPLALMRRKVLEAEHLALAIGTICNTTRSVSNNLMLSHRDGLVLNFECAPDEVFPVFPSNGMVVHANHWTSPVALSKLRDTGLRNTPESLYRDWRVRDALVPKSGQLDFEDLRQALFDDFGYPWSVCRPMRDSLFGNLSATVAMLLLDATEGTMEIAPMPATNRVFTRYSLAGGDAV